ncbi:hypothetical protein [Parasphingorhabdus sp.]|uniref:hypothetical protein n=1 Tax=Parasphingorhabdus sp. TaxID=2709688 RepID=UPI003D2BB96B
MTDRSRRWLPYGCIFVLFSCSGLTQPMPEIRVAVEMPASEFNNLNLGKQSEMQLNESESDFWGTDEVHKLTIDLPLGEIQFDGGGHGHATFVTATPLSSTSKITSIARIRSVTFNMFREDFSLTKAIDIAEHQCEKIVNLIDNSMSDYNQKKLMIDNVNVGDGFFVCRVWNEEIEFVVSLTKISLASSSNPSSAEFTIDGWVGRNTDKR